jgi:hypothetical protein
MNNQNEVLLPAVIEGESDVQYVYRVSREIGALAVFTFARNHYISQFAELQKTNPKTLEERHAIAKLANDMRNELIVQQTACDRAYEFEQITATGDRRVN